MTAKDREIQVYEMNEDQTPSDWPRDFVAHADHLRHMKLAQIAVLENVYSEDHPDEVCENIEYKIAALRKELEG